MNTTYATCNVPRASFNILSFDTSDKRYSVTAITPRGLIVISKSQSKTTKREVTFKDKRIAKHIVYITYSESDNITIDLQNATSIKYEVEIKLKELSNSFYSRKIECHANSHLYTSNNSLDEIILTLDDFIDNLVETHQDRIHTTINIYPINGDLPKNDIRIIQNFINMPKFLESYLVKFNSKDINTLIIGKQLSKGEFIKTKSNFCNLKTTKEINIVDKTKTIIKYLGTGKPLTEKTILMTTSGMHNLCNIKIAKITYDDKDIKIPQSYIDYSSNMIWESKIDNWVIRLIAKYSFSKEQLSENAKLLSTISEDSWLDIATHFEAECVSQITNPLSTMEDIDNMIKKVILNYESNAIIREIGEILGNKTASTIKKLTNQAISLDVLVYRNIYPPLHWYISEKVDGIHVLIYINDNKLYVVESKATDMGNVDESNFYLFEAEKVTTKDNKTLLLIFDVLAYKSEVITQKPFNERCKLLNDAVTLVTSTLANNSTYTDQTRPIVNHKNWEQINDEADLKTKLTKIYKQVYNYKQDGIIYMESNKSYHEGMIYKWKPIEQLTIDFLIKKCPKKMLGVVPYIPKDGMTLYWLCSGIKASVYTKLGKTFPPGFTEGKKKHHLDQYFPIVFSPPSDPLAYIYYSKDDTLDNKVVELSWDKITNNWKFERIRDDRVADLATGTYYGNDYKVAELTWLAIQFPLTFEDLYSLKVESYFKEQKLDKYSTCTKYNSFIKGSLIELYCKDVDWVIDLGSGKGQDLYKYSSAGIKHLTMVEMDTNAIFESLQRRFMSKEKLFDITSIQGDLSKSKDIYNKIMNIRKQVISISGKLVDVIVCNFAIHYFMHNISELIAVIATLLKKGGYFIFTTFDGKRIFNLLEKLKFNESWTIVEDNEIKYKIEKRFDNTKFEKCGQKIGVLLPFSQTQLYEEELVNFDYLNDILKSVNFKKVASGSFHPDTISKELQISFPSFIYDLTEGDKEFVSLYSYGIYTKTKDSEFAEVILDKKE